MKHINNTFQKIIQEIELMFLKEKLNDFEFEFKDENYNIDTIEYSYSIKKLNVVFFIKIYMNWSNTLSSYASGQVVTQSMFNLHSPASLNIREITPDGKEINQILRKLRIFIKKISLLKEISKAI